MKFYETETFKALEAEWDERLRASGFVDIEKDREHLRERSSNAFRQAVDSVRGAKSLYYELLNQGYQGENFSDALHAWIMGMLCRGMTRRAMQSELLRIGYDVHYETIRYIICRYEYKWQIKKYSAKQMKLKRLPMSS